MTRYTVSWLEGAQEHLAEVWLNAPNKQAVTDAANAIEVELARDADKKGMAVSEGLRTLHIPPLHVLFTVSEPDRLVEVVSVRSDQPPGGGSPRNGPTEPTS